MTVSDSPGCFIGRNTPYLKSPLPVSPLVPPLPLCGMMYVQSSTLCHRWWKQDFWGHVAVWKRILQDSANRSVMCETWSLRYKHAENDLEMTQIWIFIDFRICFKCWRRRRWHFKDFDKIADVFFFFFPTKRHDEKEKSVGMRPWRKNISHEDTILKTCFTSFTSSFLTSPICLVLGRLCTSVLVSLWNTTVTAGRIRVSTNQNNQLNKLKNLPKVKILLCVSTSDVKKT